MYSALTNISSNSVGNDGISLKFIKIIFREIKYILCHIFNYSIRNSVYPSVWKRALVIPLPKVANPTETKHYRPINILCVIGKIILDKIVYKQVYRFLNENEIMYKYQSGYRVSHSTQTALVKLTDDIRKAMEQKVDNTNVTLFQSCV